MYTELVNYLLKKLINYNIRYDRIYSFLNYICPNAYIDNSENLDLISASIGFNIQVDRVLDACKTNGIIDKDLLCFTIIDNSSEENRFVNIHKLINLNIINIEFLENLISTLHKKNDVKSANGLPNVSDETVNVRRLNNLNQIIQKAQKIQEQKYQESCNKELAYVAQKSREFYKLSNKEYLFILNKNISFMLFSFIPVRENTIKINSNYFRSLSTDDLTNFNNNFKSFFEGLLSKADFTSLSIETIIGLRSLYVINLYVSHLYINVLAILPARELMHKIEQLSLVTYENILDDISRDPNDYMLSIDPNSKIDTNSDYKERIDAVINTVELTIDKSFVIETTKKLAPIKWAQMNYFYSGEPGASCYSVLDTKFKLIKKIQIIYYSLGLVCKNFLKYASLDQESDIYNIPYEIRFQISSCLLSDVFIVQNMSIEALSSTFRIFHESYSHQNVIINNQSIDNDALANKILTNLFNLKFQTVNSTQCIVY